MTQKEYPPAFTALLEGWMKEVGNIQAVWALLDIVLTKLTWDQLLLCLSNVAFRKHEKEPDKKIRKRWLAHCHVLHDAMETEKARRLQAKLAPPAEPD